MKCQFVLLLIALIASLYRILIKLEMGISLEVDLCRVVGVGVTCQPIGQAVKDSL